MAWNWNDVAAECSQGDWRAIVVPGNPGAGLQFYCDALRSTSPGIPIGSFFQWNTDKKWETSAETYVRDNDVVIAYSEAHLSSFSLQFNYGLVPAIEQNDLGIELWISVQTPLLDAHPTVLLHADAAKGSTIEMLTASQFHLQPSGEIVAASGSKRCGSKTIHWLQLVHPLDLRDTEWLHHSGGASNILPLSVFGGFMEKGVLRRARLRLLLSHEPFTLLRAQKEFESFAVSELPLTT